MGSHPYKYVWVGKRAPSQSERANAVFDAEIVESDPVSGLRSLVETLFPARTSRPWVEVAKAEAPPKSNRAQNSVAKKIREGKRERQISAQEFVRGAQTPKARPEGPVEGEKRPRRRVRKGKLSPEKARAAVETILRSDADFASVVRHRVPPKDVRALATKVASEVPDARDRMTSFLAAYKQWGNESRRLVAEGKQPVHWVWGA